MADTIKNLSIAGGGSREIGAEAQNIEVSYDANGNIIPDIDASGVQVDHKGSLTQALNDKAKKNHADATNKYGAATKAAYGHVKLGAGLQNAVDGSTTLEPATETTIGGVKVDGDTVFMDEDGVLHAGAAGGSNIEIRTSEIALLNKEVIISAADGGEEVVTVFDSEGKALVKGYMGVGTINFLSIGDDGREAKGNINIPYFGNYEITLAFWSAPVNITTSTPEMYEKTITVRKDGFEVGTATFSSTGAANYIAHSPGTYVFECTIGWRTFSSTLIVSAEQNYSVNIQGFVANITVTTVMPEFKNAVVAVSSTNADVPISSVVLGDDNKVIYKAYDVGTYTFTITYDGEDYLNNVTVNGQGEYTVAINMQTSIVVLHTDDFANRTGTVENNLGLPQKTFSFDAEGNATYRVHKPGTYVFSITE